MLAQSSGAHSNTSKEKDDKDDAVLVFGDGFVFSLKEPDGWHSVCGPEASEYGVNAVLIPSSAQSRARHVIIRVRVNPKTDENTLEDLKAGMRQYKQRYPKVQFAALDVTHAEYNTYTKLFAFPDDFYDHVAYVNPGPSSSFTLSVSMAKEKAPASHGELAAYANVVTSLHVPLGNATRQH